MAILMNKATWDSLPEADRAALEAASGRAMAEWIAGVVDSTDAEIEASFRAAGEVKFIDLDDAAVADWNAALAPAADAWVAGQADADTLCPFIPFGAVHSTNVCVGTDQCNAKRFTNRAAIAK